MHLRRFRATIRARLRAQSQTYSVSLQTFSLFSRHSVTKCRYASIGDGRETAIARNTTAQITLHIILNCPTVESYLYHTE